MKFKPIRISSRSGALLGHLKTSTGLTPNILARFAICLSIKDKSFPNPDEFNKEGSEIRPSVLFGEHESIYLALMLDRLKQDRLDPEIYLDEMLRSHLNRGVIALRPRINDLSDFYELVKEERNVWN